MPMASTWEMYTCRQCHLITTGPPRHTADCSHACMQPPSAPLLQETHPYFTIERIRAREGDVHARSFKEAADIAHPVFHPPWQPLKCVAGLPASAVCHQCWTSSRAV
jgi:hypothetical protein